MEASPAPQPVRSLSHPRRAAVLVCLLLALIVGALVTMAAGTVQTLSAVRAYTAGEALYSKSQKDAVHHLLLYATSRDPGALARGFLLRGLRP